MVTLNASYDEKILRIEDIFAIFLSNSECNIIVSIFSSIFLYFLHSTYSIVFEDNIKNIIIETALKIIK